MPENTVSDEVPSHPLQVAENSDAKKGAGNVEESAFARGLAAKQLAMLTQEAPAEQAQESAPPAEVTQETSSEAKPEETKEEEKSDTPEEPKEEADEVLSPETHSLDPKAQAAVNRRIGKEVAKTKREIEARVAAETKLAELEAKLAEKPEAPEYIPVPANVPLPEITTIDQLNTYRENLSNDIIEAEMLLHADIPPEGIDTKWGRMTKPALISALTQAKKDERVAIPARERFLNTRAQATQTAVEKFPFLKDPASEGYKMAKQALRENPVLRSYPNSEYLVGMIVKGQLAMKAEEAKPEAKAPAKPKPKPTGGQTEVASDSSASRIPVGTLRQQALDNETNKLTAKKGVSEKDFSAALAAKQLIRLTR